jgi:hypothetical protein
MHGGAHGSGAPSGQRNGNYRHGLHTAEAKNAAGRDGADRRIDMWWRLVAFDY